MVVEIQPPLLKLLSISLQRQDNAEIDMMGPATQLLDRNALSLSFIQMADASCFRLR